MFAQFAKNTIISIRKPLVLMTGKILYLNKHTFEYNFNLRTHYFLGTEHQVHPRKIANDTKLPTYLNAKLNCILQHVF